MQGAQALIEAHKNKGEDIPDPSFTLRLPNDIHSGSNLFAFQKIFDGKFQFDIFFESADVKQKIDCLSLRFPNI